MDDPALARAVTHGLDSLAERVARIVDRHWPPRQPASAVQSVETSEIEAKTA